MTPAISDTAALLAGWCHHPGCVQAARGLLFGPNSNDELLRAAIEAVCRLGAPCLQHERGDEDAAAQLFVELVAERRRALYARQRFQARQLRLQRVREQRESRRRRVERKTAAPISKDEVFAAIARARAKRQAND